jgi:hypothetical protein
VQQLPVDLNKELKSNKIEADAFLFDESTNRGDAEGREIVGAAAIAAPRPAARR